jgi:beta-lactam-binding protein with PASTA domain
VIGALIVAAILIAAAVAKSGSGSVRVPRFVDLSRQDARVKAENLGLVPRFELQPSAGPAGYVIGQDPHAGASLLKGAQIVLVLSEASIPVTPSPRSPKPKPPGHDDHGKDHGKDHPKHEEKH